MITSPFDTFEEEQHISLKTSFDKYYHNTLLPFLKQKEDIRTKYVNRFWFLLLISAIILPMLMLTIYFFNHYYHKDITWSYVYILAAAAIFALRSPFAAYRHKVKNDVMDLFVKFFNGFEYFNGQGLSKSTLNQSRIFPVFDYSAADDCFGGIYEGVRVNVYEEILTKQVSNSKGKTKNKIVFKGIAVELGMNKNFSGQTIAVKDSGMLNVFKKYDGMERIKLEDVVFEDIFEVFSTNQVEARYLLTTAFMERLLKLRKLYAGKKIEVSFFNDKILIAIDTREDMFEPCSFFKTNLNKPKFDMVFEQFWTIFSIVHILKLNQNIGM